LKEKDLESTLKFKAIFILSNPVESYINLQIMLDHLTTEDGGVADKLQAPDKHIPIYSVTDDL